MPYQEVAHATCVWSLCKSYFICMLEDVLGPQRGHLKEHESPRLVPPSGKLMSFPTQPRQGTPGRPVRRVAALPACEDGEEPGVAMSVTTVPLLKSSEQVDPQAIPAALDVTVPPATRPVFVTVKGTVNVKLLALSAVPTGVVTVRGPVVAPRTPSPELPYWRLL